MCFSSLLHIRKSSSRRWFLTLWLVWKSVSGPRFSIPQGMWKLEEMSKYSFIQPFYSEIEIICMIVRCLSECHLQRKELKCMLDMLSCSAVTQRVKVVIFAHLAVTSLFLMSSFASYKPVLLSLIPFLQVWPCAQSYSTLSCFSLHRGRKEQPVGSCCLNIQNLTTGLRQEWFMPSIHLR